MSQTVFGAQATVTFLNRAFNNTAPGNLIFQNQVGAAGTTRESQEAFARTFGDGFASLSDAALSERVLTNMGVLPSEDTALLALQADLAAYFGANAPADRGLIVLQLSEIMANLTNATGAQAVYAPIAAAWNNEITKSFEYSVVASNTATSDPLDTPVDPNPIQNYTLTTAQDVLSGTEGANTIRGVAGAAIGSQDQTTLNSSDIIDGKAGEDALIVLLNGNYGGGATIKNVETLQIGTNNAAAVQFDYNVNNGAYEVTGVNTVVYDQITTGESLNVVNVTPSATGSVIPTLSWENEAGSVAGTAGVTFRQAAVAATDTNLNVVFANVTAQNSNVATGVLNIGAGVETATLSGKTGTTTAVTLNNSTNLDTLTNAPAADIVSSGTLTKVVLTGDVAFGKAAGVVTGNATATLNGLTDRVVATDTGIGGAAAPTTTTASNLLSVGSRVTTVDASALNADSNVRFVAKNDNSDTNVTFKGGNANDYVELERGNVSVEGGTGADTFAFVTQAAGITNSGFGSNDTIKGGTGADTVQIGLNGVGTYTLNTTEFSNKSGIETLDVRGQNNDITLSSDFVAGVDVGKFTIRTDKMVQTSATSTVDPTGGSLVESTSTSVVNLTGLTQGVAVIGGSGSERVVVNNASLNGNTEIDGGTNGGVAGRYDTVTILNTTVADAGDLANVKGIESLILAETVTGNSRFDIALTEAFLLANTAATNSATTTIDDTVFRIGSATSSTGTALNAGDTVVIDISGLLNATRTALSTNLAGRGIDVAFAAGITPSYVVDGAAATAAQVALVTKADAARADAGSQSAAGVVVAPTATVALAAAGTFTGTAGVNDTFTGTIAALSGTTVTGTAADTETLTLTTAGTVAINNGTTGGTVTNVDNLVLANGVNTVTFTATSGITNVTGGTDVDDVNTDNLAASTSVALGAGNDTLRASGTLTGTLAGGDGVADVLTGTATAATNISGATVSGFEVLDFGNSATPFTMTRGQFSGFTSFTNFTAGGAAADAITFSDAGAITLNTGAGTYNLANGTNTVDATTTANYLLTGGTGADTFNFGAQLTAADTVAGGTGTDVLTVTGAATGSVNVTAVETIQVNYATAATFTTGAIAPGVASTITAAGSTAAVTLDASLYTPTTSLGITDGQGNDTITVSTTDANRALTTVSLATGGNDTVVINDAAVNDAVNSAVTVTGFGATDKIATQLAGAATSTGVFLNNYSGAAAQAVGAAGVLEIDAAAFQVGTPSNTAALLAWLTAKSVTYGPAAAGTATVIAYNGAGQAAIYHVSETAAGGTTAFDTAELIGLVNATDNSLVAANFA